MNAGDADWEVYLSELLKLSGSDFCSVASYDTSARQIRWIAASGNTNEKFRHIVNRPSQGMTGEVIRIARTVQKICTTDEQRRNSDSIMLAERLIVAAATPISSANNEIVGILLIGRRTDRLYTATELTMLENAAKCLSINTETAS